MTFKDMRIDDYSQFLKELYPQNPIKNYSLIGTVFWMIEPIENTAVFPLKKHYKPTSAVAGIHTKVLGGLRDRFREQARDKVARNGLLGMNYQSDEASFKLHIGLNGIGELDDSIVKGLSKLLVDRAR